MEREGGREGNSEGIGDDKLRIGNWMIGEGELTRVEYQGRFLSMGGVWSTYGAGAENGTAKNCKIAPWQDRPAETTAGNRSRPPVCYVKKLIFFTFDFSHFLDIINIYFL